MGDEPVITFWDIVTTFGIAAICYWIIGLEIEKREASRLREENEKLKQIIRDLQPGRE